MAVTDLGWQTAAACHENEKGAWHGSGRPAVSRKREGTLPYRAGLRSKMVLVGRASISRVASEQSRNLLSFTPVRESSGESRLKSVMAYFFR